MSAPKMQLVSPLGAPRQVKGWYLCNDLAGGLVLHLMTDQGSWQLHADMNQAGELGQSLVAQTRPGSLLRHGERHNSEN